MRGRGGGQWRVKSSDEEDALQQPGSTPQATTQPQPVAQPQPQLATHGTNKQTKPDDVSKRHHSEKGARDKKPTRDEGRRRRENTSKSNEDPNAKLLSEADKIKAEEEKKRKEEEEQKRWGTEISLN
jgi:hypothetical protein